MPPLNNLDYRLSQLELTVKTHKHKGIDFTPVLDNLSMVQIGKYVFPAAATSGNLSIPVRQFLRVIISFGAKSGASDDYLRFGGASIDAGANYAFINSGAAARTSQNQIDIRDGANSALGAFSVIDIANNLSTLVKSVSIHTIDKITSAATSQTFYQIFGTWVNTTAFITQLSLVSSGAQTYPADTTLIVLGSKE